MKKVLSLSIVTIFAVTIFSGCQGNSVKKLDELLTGTAIVKGDGQFPECLVGLWQSDGFNWAFKFEPDGTIKKFRHVIFPHVGVDMDEPVIELQGPEEGTFAIFVMGDLITGYDPETSTLAVRIFLDHYEMKLPNGTLEGTSNDSFIGKVSEDCKTWNVEWRAYGTLVGADIPDRALVDANPELIVFKKVDLDVIKERQLKKEKEEGREGHDYD